MDMIIAAAAVLAAAAAGTPPAVHLPGGTSYVLVREGAGTPAASGNYVAVHYTGWLFDPAPGKGGRGVRFDSSRDRADPFVFLLGGGEVIGGWDEGVVGMKPGEQRTLIVPPEMGYGARGAGGVIPPGATLVFDVELLQAE
jgi:FKBP-type peptidyl-prolyl cis-trans isomerase FkpA